jgi:5-methylcytosine-specific restriction endonuclease McrA
MVFVIDRKKRPLMPCTEKRARLLLERGRAVVVSSFPFTIRLKDRVDGVVQPVRIKFDPGSGVSGSGIVRESETGSQVVLALFEIQHRGKAIRELLQRRRAYRRRRRSANLRYREKRFDNRRRPDGWLPPSIRSRVDNIVNFTRKIMRGVPLTGITVEDVRFDMQKLQNPEITGTAYQQGTLFGYEVREYLLEKWDRKCAYCDTGNVPLQIEHIIPKSRGGSDRVSNLALSCEKCNLKKNTKTASEFLAGKPGKLSKIQEQRKKPLAAAAAVNSARKEITRKLSESNLSVSTSSGGRTKWNRTRFGIPKRHCLDAICVGDVEEIENWEIPVLVVKAMGRGSYQRTRVDRYGFRRGILSNKKFCKGFKTGDMVTADVPKGKNAGAHTGRVAIRQCGSFNIQTGDGTIQGVSWKYFTMVSKADGYNYKYEKLLRLLPMDKSRGFRRKAV